MPNIQTLNALQSLGTYLGGVDTPINLDNASVTGVYVIDDGSSIVEYTYAVKNSKYVTKITTPLGISYVTDKSGVVADAVVNDCPACEPYVNPVNPVEIVSSCTDPVYVQICNTTDPEIELEFTDAIPICVDNGDGTFSTWYTREMITWNELTSTIVTRITEYSKDGVTWTTTAPNKPFTLGACDIDPQCSPLICEAFGNDLSTLCAGHNFSITKPSCCKIKVTTDIGSFTLVGGIQHYSTSDFQCPVTITAIEILGGGCTLDQIHIISNKLK
jgi:hypothetical protein